MSSFPPYNNDNPYPPSTQYQPQSGYYPPDQPPQSGYYPPDQPQPYGYQQQIYAAQPQYMAMPVMPINDPGSGAALTGMILGIVGLFFPLAGAIGLIFSIIGMKSITRKGMAIAGLILSIISILEIIMVVAFVIIAIAATAATSTGGY